jgi:hypothetical protein
MNDGAITKWWRRLLLASCVATACTPKTSRTEARPAGSSASAEPARAARIYASTDAGASWHPSDAGFPQRGTVNDFALSGATLLAATEADGVWLSRDRGHGWQRSVSWPREQAKVNAVLASEGVLLAGTHGGGVLVSSDAGQSWEPRRVGLWSLEVRRLAAHLGQVYAATNAGLFVASVTGERWRQLTSAGQVNAIAFVGDDMFVAEVGSVRRSGDQGQRWSVVLPSVTAHDLFGDGNTLFALLYGAGVKKSSDRGETWSLAQAGLPRDLTQYTFQVRRAGDALFAAQWQGVFVSHSSGDAWQPAGLGLHDAAITDVIENGAGGLLAGAGLPR